MTEASATTADLRIDYVDLDELPAATRNARRHSLDAIAGAIGSLGFTRPGLLDERTGRLVAGHGRKLVLLRELERGNPPPEGIRQTTSGWAMPIVRGWSSRSDSHADAVALADNAVGQTGGFDDAVLFDILGDLAGDAPELLRATTYTSEDLDRLMVSTSGGTERTDLDHLAGPAPVDSAGEPDRFTDRERPEPGETSRDEQWDVGQTSEDKAAAAEEAPGALDVAPAWRTLQPWRAVYHSGGPEGAGAVVGFLRGHAAGVTIEHPDVVTWDTPDGPFVLVSGKWLTRDGQTGRFEEWSLAEFAERFVPANEPARRVQRDAKPPTVAPLTDGQKFLRHGAGFVTGAGHADAP